MKEFVPLLAYVILLFHQLAAATVPLHSSELLSKQKEGLVVELIHHDFSPLSPFYNISMTQTEIFLNAAIRSGYRAKSINSIHLNYHLSQASDYSTLVPTRGSWLMYLYIGTPPVESLVGADTGSDVTWVQCSPCDHCYRQNTPYFDPNKSSSNIVAECDSYTCDRYFNHNFCTDDDKCKYKVAYGDGSITKGIVMTDTVSLNKERIMSYHLTVMGCGRHNEGLFKPEEVGLAGLGGGDASLMSQILYSFKKKFAYCFDHKASTKLYIGVDTQTNKTHVVTTPMVRNGPSTFYYLSLEGVKIEDKVLKPTGSTVGNIIIDCGAVLTYLSLDLYKEVELAVVLVMGEQTYPIKPVRPFSLCYRRSKIIYFPDIIFQFAGHAELKFNFRNTLIPMGDDAVCLGIVPTNGLSILGSYILVSFNVEYDLDQKTISFASGDCSQQ